MNIHFVSIEIRVIGHNSRSCTNPTLVRARPEPKPHTGTGPIHTCRICGQYGHNARTCPAKQAAGGDAGGDAGGAPPTAAAAEPRAPPRRYPVVARGGELRHLSFNFVPAHVDRAAPITVAPAAGGGFDVTRASESGGTAAFRGQRGPASALDYALVLRDGGYELRRVASSVVKITHVRGDDDDAGAAKPPPKKKRVAPKRAKPAPAAPPATLAYERADAAPRDKDDLVCRPRTRLRARARSPSSDGAEPALTLSL